MCRQDAEFLNVTASGTSHTVTTGLCTVNWIILLCERFRIFLLHTHPFKGIHIFPLSISFLFPLLVFFILFLFVFCFCSFYISSVFIEFLDSVFFLFLFCPPYHRSKKNYKSNRRNFLINSKCHVIPLPRISLSTPQNIVVIITIIMSR